MNFLVIVADTVRRDHLDCYGGAVGTPNLARLAEQSVVFENAYCGSFPTLPCRAELFTGSIVFPYLDWGPLPEKPPVLSEALGRAYYNTALFSDNLPMSRPGHGYGRGFHTRNWIRGQYYDAHRPVTGDLPWPAPKELLGQHGRVQQYLHNIQGRESEEDYFAPRTVDAACRWLEREHRNGRFFLWVDLFDPHEPWDPPKRYLRPEEQEIPWIVYPRFGAADQYAPEHLEALRALYRGELRMVDRWIGRLLERLAELGLEEDTCVVFLSDHGIFLGEHNLLGKASRIGGDLRGWPTYVEVSRIPLMMRIPGVKPRRVEALCHPGDVTPTLLDLAGVKTPETMRARSLQRVLQGEEQKVRDIAVSSWSLRPRRATRPSVVRDPEWSLVFWRSGMAPELFHRATDPGETRNVAERHPAEVKRLHAEYLRFLRENGCTPGNYWSRRWLVSWDSGRAWDSATRSAPAGLGSS